MTIISKEDKIAVEVYDVLKHVIDPELGINIIDMGLVYLVKYTEQDGIKINMTFSSKGCPMGDLIIKNMEEVLLEHFPGTKNIINLVWDPKWTSDFITPKGKTDLNLI